MKDGQSSSTFGDLIFQNWVPGKILLSGEYVVLDGATALGLVSHRGQSMKVYRGGIPGLLQWTALDHRDKPWLQAGYRLIEGQWCKDNIDDSASEPCLMLQNWLQTAWSLMAHPSNSRENSPKRDSLTQILLKDGLRVQTHMDFPRGWGLGSSSTALALLAQWLGVNARQLYALTQNGSGYDLEIALQNSSILYRLTKASFNPKPPTSLSKFPSDNPRLPSVHKVTFQLPRDGQLWLVDPGGKQTSASEVIRYLEIDESHRLECVDKISSLSLALATCTNVTTMMDYLAQHDAVMEKLLGQSCLHHSVGHGFPGRLKSLGAWGGDLFLAVSDHPEEALQWLESHENWSIHPFERLIRCEP